MKSDDGASASHDAEYEALLQELRVLLPGVEILFAFLLSIAFTARFDSITQHLKWVYLVALGSAAIASVLLTTPGVYHRLRWREAHKEDVLRRSNTLAVAGTAFLAVAATTGLFVATSAVFDSTVAGVLSGVVGGVTVLSWYVLPLLDRNGGGRSRTPAPAPSKEPARASRR